jgi:hypothetical protein
MPAPLPEAIRASAMTLAPGTRAIMACGIAAGPLFMLVAVSDLCSDDTRP